MQTILNPKIDTILQNIKSYKIPYKLIDAIGEIPTIVLLAILLGIKTGAFHEVNCKSYLNDMLDDKVYHIDNDILKALIPGISFKVKKIFQKLERLGFFEIVGRVENGRYIQFNSIRCWNHIIMFGIEPHYAHQIERLWHQITKN